MAGIMYIAATPIGNMGDVTARFVEVLGQADFVACEDTRRSGQLLARLGVHLPLIRLDEHASERNLAQCMDRLAQGQTGIYMSDAGTPGVSDPGSRLVRAAVEAGIVVRALPGAAAVAVGLSLSGFEGRQFAFAGFLPRQHDAIVAFAHKWFALHCLVIMFPSPHRVQKELGYLAEVYSDVPGVLLREMTKLHETHYRGTLQELAAMDLPGRGEYTLMADASCLADKKPDLAPDDLAQQIERFRALGLAGKLLVDVVCEATGAAKKHVYSKVHANSDA